METEGKGKKMWHPLRKPRQSSPAAPDGNQMEESGWEGKMCSFETPSSDHQTELVSGCGVLSVSPHLMFHHVSPLLCSVGPLVSSSCSSSCVSKAVKVQSVFLPPTEMLECGVTPTKRGR